MPSYLKIDFLRGNTPRALSKGRIIRTMLIDHPYQNAPLPPGILTPPQLGELIDRLQVAYDQSLSRDVGKVQACSVVRLEFNNAFRNLARHLEIWANGDLSKLQNLGYDVRQAPKRSAPPAGPLPAPKLKVKHGLTPGTMIARMSVLAGALMYELYMTSGDPSQEGNWGQQGLHAHPSKIDIPGLTSGQGYWIRGRGIGATGNGLWSAPFPLMSL